MKGPKNNNNDRDNSEFALRSAMESGKLTANQQQAVDKKHIESFVGKINELLDKALKQNQQLQADLKGVLTTAVKLQAATGKFDNVTGAKLSGKVYENSFENQTRSVYELVEMLKDVKVNVVNQNAVLGAAQDLTRGPKRPGQN